jgi:hypothetical protein
MKACRAAVWSATPLTVWPERLTKNRMMISTFSPSACAMLATWDSQVASPVAPGEHPPEGCIAVASIIAEG